MDTIQLHSHVDPDGILRLQVPLSASDANADVIVTIEPLSSAGDEPQHRQMAWHDFVEQTYGSCAGLGLKRYEPGEFELREPLE